MIRRKRTEVVAFETERIIVAQAATICPVCSLYSELLTRTQACALLQVSSDDLSGWLTQGKIHGIKTPGGDDRLCRKSLFWH